MDLNFMSVLSHSLEQQSKMSTELLYNYINNQQACKINYDLVMVNFLKTLEK